MSCSLTHVLFAMGFIFHCSAPPSSSFVPVLYQRSRSSFVGLFCASFCVHIFFGMGSDYTGLSESSDQCLRDAIEPRSKSFQVCGARLLKVWSTRGREQAGKYRLPKNIWYQGSVSSSFCETTRSRVLSSPSPAQVGLFNSTNALLTTTKQRPTRGKRETCTTPLEFFTSVFLPQPPHTLHRPNKLFRTGSV